MHLKTTLKTALLSVCTVSMLFMGCGSDDDDSNDDDKKQEQTTESEEPGNIPETAKAAGTFETLLAAVDAAELGETLSGEGPFTVFAPSDDAFAKIPEADLNALLEDKEKLKSVLLYHVGSGKIMAEEVLGSEGLTTVQGQTAEISKDGDKAYIDGAQIIQTDIEASNGVIHVIDTVIMPKEDIIETAKANGNFTTLLTAIEEAGLTETLKGDGPFTVFAPTNDAFAKIPKADLDALLADKDQLTAVLTYHVVSGTKLAADVVAEESLTSLESFC